MVNGRTLCFGNLSLMGVILTYGDPSLVPRGAGFNPVPREVGDQVQADLVELLRAGRIKPFVGKTVPFEALPQALDEMLDRATVGRVVVEVR
jgi:NADPH2:quinone reductase